jgi:hypothetical protein
VEYTPHCWVERVLIRKHPKVSERTQYDIDAEMLQFSWTGDVLMSVKASLILLSALHAVYKYLC